MKKVIKIVVFSLLGIGVIATFIFLWKKSQPKDIIYEIVEPQVGTIEKKTVVTGKIEPRDEVSIKPQVSGIISEIRKEPGQIVQVGDIIAIVKVIPEISSLTSAESQVRISKMNLDNVSKTYNRQKELKQKGVISSEEFEKSTLEYEKAKEDYESANDNLNIVKEGISKKYSQYSNTQIRATISGMILDIPVKVGNSVILSNTFNDGTTIATVANLKDMIFKGKMDETEVGKVKEGMNMILTIGALNDIKFNAILEYISPKGTEDGGAVFFEMKAAAKIPDTTFLRAGYSANAEIILEKAKDVIIVPESSIEYNGDSTFVYVLDTQIQKQTFNRKPVKVGLSDGIHIEIKSGIDKTDKIRGNIKV